MGLPSNRKQGGFSLQRTTAHKIIVHSRPVEEFDRSLGRVTSECRKKDDKKFVRNKLACSFEIKKKCYSTTLSALKYNSIFCNKLAMHIVENVC